MISKPEQELSEDERAGLAAGQHLEVAQQLATRGRSDLAGWVREQVWDFEGAFEDYRVAERPFDQLRAALETGSPKFLDQALADLEARGDRESLQQAIALLEKRRRPMEAARLHAFAGNDPAAHADALLRAGDRLGAARALARAEQPREALGALMPDGRPPTRGPALALAARLAWDLGDAEAAARYAQQALRAGVDETDTIELLARALGSLGHDLAAQMVLKGHDIDLPERGVPGRYRVTGLGPVGLTGAAYVGFDRVTLQEVEIHLLLADMPDAGPIDPNVDRALGRFAQTAEAAAALGHPAIRPISRIMPKAGLLVFPRAEGPDLKSMIRPPGLATAGSRVRALIAFLAEGLAAAHAKGLVHGWMLPSQISCDVLGRPMLGPFGAHHLAGLAATHTGALEEIMTVTAPELRDGGAQPTIASDLYALGALLGALLAGRLQRLTEVLDELPPAPEIDLARALLDPDPLARPELREVLRILHRRIADIRDLDARWEEPAPDGKARSEESSAAFQHGIVVEPASSWSDDLLETLCREANPWLQTIVDREGRRLVLAPWPEGSAALDDSAGDSWRDLVPGDALEFESSVLRAALQERLAPSSLVRTPSGAWMLALDDLLMR